MSDGDEREVDVVGSNGNGPRFVESRIHLAWSDEGTYVLVMKSVPIVESWLSKIGQRHT